MVEENIFDEYHYLQCIWGHRNSKSSKSYNLTSGEELPRVDCRDEVNVNISIEKTDGDFVECQVILQEGCEKPTVMFNANYNNSLGSLRCLGYAKQTLTNLNRKDEMGWCNFFHDSIVATRSLSVHDGQLTCAVHFEGRHPIYHTVPLFNSGDKCLHKPEWYKPVVSLSYNAQLLTLDCNYPGALGNNICPVTRDDDDVYAYMFISSSFARGNFNPWGI